MQNFVDAPLLEPILLEEYDAGTVSVDRRRARSFGRALRHMPIRGLQAAGNVADVARRRRLLGNGRRNPVSKVAMARKRKLTSQST